MNLLTTLKTINKKISNYFFADKYNAYPLVTLRIGVCIILLLQFIQLKANIYDFVSDNGLIRQDIVTIVLPTYLITSSKLAALLNTYFHLNELQALSLLGYMYVTSILFLFIGLFTRNSAFVCWILHLAFISSGHYFTYGVDYFLTMFLFYMIIFPVGREYSVDKRIFKLKPVNYTPYIRMLQIHICLVYFISGIVKCLGEDWWNGISIWKAINRPDETIVGRFDFINIHTLSHFNVLYIAGGIATIFVETLYPVFINIPKTRKLWLSLTCLFHIFIAVVLNLPYFAAIMILFNIVTYYYPYREIIEQAETVQLNSEQSYIDRTIA